MEEINGSFQVDIERLHSLGVIDPNSIESLEIYRSGKLNSNERLYFSLWGSKDLNSTMFDAKQKIMQKGDDITSAYFIVSGTALSLDGRWMERLGPGSIIGLAEGIIGIRSSKTIIAVSPIQARILPINKIIHVIPKLPSVIQKIIINLANRSINLSIQSINNG
jgi:CRP-like cAMP-binding protein